MLEKEALEELLNEGIRTGADFIEIFQEQSKNKKYLLVNRKLEKITTEQLAGVSTRIAQDKKMVFGSVSSFLYSDIKRQINQLQETFSKKETLSPIQLSKLEEYQMNIKIPHENISELEKKQRLLFLDQMVRSYSPLVSQVKIMLFEEDQTVRIASYHGFFRQEKRTRTRLFINIYVKRGEKTESSYVAVGGAVGYELWEQHDLKTLLKQAVTDAIEQLDATPCPGGKMPVVIKNGFGAVIFHEACGHALETDRVHNGQSILQNCLEKKIASDQVTLIDDGAIENSWGSTRIDDEGYETKQNILIDKGILKKYLNDEFHDRFLNVGLTGSSRRENYHYIPVSRMNNTYLAPGKDKIEDMIKSISYGLYCYCLSGGQVDPTTGNFNFGVTKGRMIRDGKLAEFVTGASLIGNAKEILYNVEMVSDDLLLETGNCGSSSGIIPVNIGQPTIKIKSITVGGSL